jgi:ketol-acid reductoisomerase
MMQKLYLCAETSFSMETTIRLKPNELNDTMVTMIKSLVKAKGITDITINLSNNKPLRSLRKENSKAVHQKIEKALKEIESGNADFISFSAEEFEKFSRSLTKK